MKKKPHILIFNPDQFRADALGHLGNPAASTPYLDKFAEEEAVSFRYAFCQNPVCTPSRCSFMTGWYPHVRGHRTMHHMLQPDEPVLLKTLKEEGYFVWWGGKNDLVPAQNSLDPYCTVYHQHTKPIVPNAHHDWGWRGAPEEDNYYSFYTGKLDKKDQEVYYDSDWDHIKGAIEMIQNAPEDQPLCIYLPLGFPHPPYGVEEPWFSKIDRNKVPDPIPVPEDWKGKPAILKGIYETQNLQGWSLDRWKELRATYYGMCARVDEQFGQLIQALKGKGIYEDTAIFVFSDHGDFTGDYGLVEKTQNTYEDCLTRVPFLIKPPAWVSSEPGIRDALVELVDFPATVEDLLGIIPQHTHFGKSLLPLIQGKTDQHKEAVFCEGGRIEKEEHCKESQSLIHEREENLYWPRLKWQQMDGPEHMKGTMIRTEKYKYVKRYGEKDELYDLTADPKECQNRVEDPQYQNILLEMKDKLLDFYQRTCDVVPHQADRRG